MNYEFITRSAISLALLYSLFFACLSRETFHRFNRAALLGIMLTSLVLPFIRLTVSRPTIVQEAVQMPTEYLGGLPAFTLTAASDPSVVTWGELLATVYQLGVMVMLGYLLRKMVQMCRLMRGGLRHTDNRGNTVILKPSVRSPFSLFRWIVMSVDDYEQHRQSILTHEQEHIRLGHTYDLLLLEAVRIFQWFNPFIWLLGHDLRAIHEYEADEAVIKQGIDAKQYQQLLVLKAVGNRLQPFANTLGRGSLKQRIIMMYQKKSNRWMMLKALFVIPAMGFALYAFATPEAVPEIQDVLEKKVVQPSKAQAESQPEEEEQAKAVDLATLIEKESDFAIDYSEEKLDEFPVRALTPDVVIIIDGKEATQKELMSLRAEDIDNVTVIKDEEAKKNLFKDILGDREVKGDVIIVETQAYAKEHGKQSTIGVDKEEEQPTHEVKAGDRIKGMIVEAPSDGTSPLPGVQISQVTPEGKVVGTTITDLNGHFEMIVNDPQNKLVFTKDGYQTVRSGMSQDMRVLMISSDSSLTSSSYTPI